MKWLRRMLGREPSERELKGRELADLVVKNDVTLARAERALAEGERIRSTARGTVKAIQRAAGR